MSNLSAPLVRFSTSVGEFAAQPVAEIAGIDGAAGELMADLERLGVGGAGEARAGQDGRRCRHAGENLPAGKFHGICLPRCVFLAVGDPTSYTGGSAPGY